MKRYKLTLIFILAAFLIVACVAVAWYCTPKTFLGGVCADDIIEIKVFDGSAGKSFVINDTKDIEYVVENVQSCTLRRDGISSGYDGFGFSLSFITVQGEVADTFIINSDDTVRDDPFFYKSESGKLCYAYLRALEEKISE